MTVLEILLNCARADLAYCLAQAERTKSVHWQVQATAARESVEQYAAMLKVPA